MGIDIDPHEHYPTTQFGHNQSLRMEDCVMPDLAPQILSAALVIFVSIGVLRLSIELLASAGKLTIDEAISLVARFKKLKATIKSEYSLSSEKLRERESVESDKTTATERTSVPDIQVPDIEETSPQPRRNWDHSHKTDRSM